MWSGIGCVAKTGEGLVKVAIVLTAPRRRHLLHELQVSIQMASRSHPDIINRGVRAFLPLSDQLKGQIKGVAKNAVINRVKFMAEIFGVAA